MCVGWGRGLSLLFVVVIDCFVYVLLIMDNRCIDVYYDFLVRIGSVKLTVVLYVMPDRLCQ